MKRPAHYHTRQSEAILSYIASLEGNHVTAGQIAADFQKLDISIGLTTVYRHLDKLVEQGKVRKYMVDGISSACFQYVEEEGKEGQDHFHLKCEDCGTLFHLQCGTLDSVEKHVLEAHAFRINTMKTVFYGKCADCFNGS